MMFVGHEAQAREGEVRRREPWIDVVGLPEHDVRGKDAQQGERVGTDLIGPRCFRTSGSVPVTQLSDTQLRVPSTPRTCRWPTRS